MADVKSFLETILGTTLVEQGNPNVSTKCPCHVDSENSCSVRVDTGLWFCHAMGKGGNLATLVVAAKGVDIAEAYRICAAAGITKEQILDGVQIKKDEEGREDNAPEIPQPILDIYVKNLINFPDMRKYMLDNFGWTQETLDELEIGYDYNTKRIAFPIRDKNGRLVNIRLYDPMSSGAMKTTSWKTGHGMSRLWPEEIPSAKRVILVEGEKDCTLANQLIKENGVEDTIAITHTTGAGTWKDHWNKRFEGKEVWICYDDDDGGDENAPKVASAIQVFATKVKVLKWPNPSKISKYDFTDFFMKDKMSWQDFLDIVESTEYWTQQTIAPRIKKPKDTTVYRPHLSEASSEKYLHKTQELTVMVAGKEIAPFAVPKKRSFYCNMDYSKNACANCALWKSNGQKTVEYAADDPTLIKFVNVSDQAQDHMIRDEHQINTRCPKVDIETDEEINIEELTIVPEIDFAEEDRPYETRTLYTTSHGVQPNKTYRMVGTTVAHPKTQHVVHFAWELEPAQDNIDDFVMTPEKHEAFKIFQPKPGQSVSDKFEEIAQDLSDNITGIIGRHDIIKAVDLCYHTVLNFKFQGRPAAKAWGDVLILGDARTGKSETVAELIKHYRLGELSVSENTSKAGLLGGLKQEAGGRWNIMWGRIPLNDRRILGIDEASGLEIDTIGALSGLRSSGIAELTKIITQKTMARTRLIWISNPRSNRSISEFAHGVEAVRELIGRPEDVARFDLVVTAATNEVPPEIVNQLLADKVSVPHVYETDLCRDLILWAWSRKSDDITFTDEAVQCILSSATEQSKRYAAGRIPLVEGGNHRLKLAKLAVAAAIRTYSTPDGSRVVVDKSHVEFVVQFLDEVYSKPSLDYSGYSENLLARINVSEEAIKEVQEWIRTHGDWAELWLRHTECRLDDFRTAFDLSAEDAKRLIFKPLTRLNMIDKNRRGAYEKTAPFIQQIKHVKETEGLTPTVMGIGGSLNDSSDSGSFGGAGSSANDEELPF